MMAAHDATLRTEAIGDELARIIQATSGLTLATCQFGSLGDIIGVADIGTVLPAVLVNPAMWVNGIRVTGPAYETQDVYRITYVREHDLATAMLPIRQQARDVAAIIACLSADPRLASLNLGQPVEVALSISNGVDWSPDEDRFMADFKTSAKVTVIKHTVFYRT